MLLPPNRLCASRTIQALKPHNFIPRTALPMPICSSPHPCRALCPFLPWLRGRTERICPRGGAGGSGPLDGTAALHKPGSGRRGRQGTREQGHSSGVALVACHCGWVPLSGTGGGAGSVLQVGMAPGASGWAHSRRDGGCALSPGSGRGGSSHPSRLHSSRTQTPNPLPILGYPKRASAFVVEVHRDSQGFAFCSISMPELTQGKGENPRNSRQKKTRREDEK